MTTTAHPPTLDRARAIWYRHSPGPVVPGLAAAVAVAAVATLAGHFVPVVGAPVFAIVLGIVIALVRAPSRIFSPGLLFASRGVLQASIVVLGTELSLSEIARTSTRSLPVMLGSLTVALVVAALLGRRLGIDRDLRSLVGVGTGICGASAIAATNAVITAAEADVSYAIATIFTFNVAAVLTFPSLAHALGLSARSFGLFAGTAVNDMSSVVAAASIYGHGAVGVAVVTKLTRTLMIVPVTMGIGWWRAARNSGTPSASRRGRLRISPAAIRRAVPTFVGWFLLAVVLNTVGVIPSSWHPALEGTAKLCIAVALAAIGLSTHASHIRRSGFRPLALGAVLWICVAVTSLGLQAVTGSLSHA